MIPLLMDLQAGYTALIRASQNDQKSCVEFLVGAGADRSIKADDGKTALDFATSPAIMAILRS